MDTEPPVEVESPPVDVPPIDEFPPDELSSGNSGSTEPPPDELLLELPVEPPPVDTEPPVEVESPPVELPPVDTEPPVELPPVFCPPPVLGLLFEVPSKTLSKPDVIALPRSSNSPSQALNDSVMVSAVNKQSAFFKNLFIKFLFARILPCVLKSRCVYAQRLFGYSITWIRESFWK